MDQGHQRIWLGRPKLNHRYSSLTMIAQPPVSPLSPISQQSDSISITRHLLQGFSTGLSSHQDALFGPGCVSRLREIARSDPMQLNVAVADMDGEILCAALPLEKPVNVKDRPYFQHAIVEKGFVLSGLLTSRDTRGGPIMVAAQAVTKAGSVAAVLVASFDIRALSQEFDKAGLPDYLIANLLTREGELLARHPPVSEYIGQTLPDFVAARSRGSSHEGVFHSVGFDGAPRQTA